MSERLTVAVPRGALFEGTLDLLDTLGVDTAEVRSNDRKLLFAEAGIVTMRPSDVPTYVEHGSADIGITGKDVLLEQVPAWHGDGDPFRAHARRSSSACAVWTAWMSSARPHAGRSRPKRPSSSS